MTYKLHVVTQYAHSVVRAFQYIAKTNGYCLGISKLSFTPTRIRHPPT